MSLPSVRGSSNVSKGDLVDSPAAVISHTCSEKTWRSLSAPATHRRRAACSGEVCSRFHTETITGFPFSSATVLS